MPTVERIRLADNNVYVVDGPDGRIAIDAGPDYAGAWEELRACAGEVTSVFVTHGHADHAGLGARWQAEGARVHLHEADHHLVGRLFPDEAGWRVLLEFVRNCGAPPELAEQLIAGIERRRRHAQRLAESGAYPPAGRGGRHPTGLRYEPFHPEPVPERLPNGLRALHLPGHTPGTVVFVAEDGAVFSGDQLLPDLTPTPGIQAEPRADPPRRFRSLPGFLEGLRRLQEMRPTRCYPGHGEPFDDVPRVLDAAIAAIEERTERVLQAVRELGCATPYEIAVHLYPRAVERRFWQFVPTIQGHLDLLEARGLVRQAGGAYCIA